MLLYDSITWKRPMLPMFSLVRRKQVGCRISGGLFDNSYLPYSVGFLDLLIVWTLV
jgi:hypothetical protein